MDTRIMIFNVRQAPDIFNIDLQQNVVIQKDTMDLMDNFIEGLKEEVIDHLNILSIYESFDTWVHRIGDEFKFSSASDPLKDQFFEKFREFKDLIQSRGIETRNSEHEHQGGTIAKMIEFYLPQYIII